MSVEQIALALVSLGLGYVLVKYPKIMKALALLGALVEHVSDDMKLDAEELADLKKKYKELVG